MESKLSNKTQINNSSNETLIWKSSSMHSQSEQASHLVDISTTNNDNHLFFMYYFVVISIISVFLNGIFVYLTTKHHQFHEAYMYIRKAYAVIDIVFPLACLIHISINVNIEAVPPCVTCTGGYVIIGLFFSALQFTAYIAIERYIFFCKPFRYQHYFNYRSILITTTAIVTITQTYIFGRGIFVERKLNPLHMICTPVNSPLSNTVNILICVIPALSCTVFSTIKIIGLINSLSNVQPHETQPYRATTEPFLRKKAVKKGLRYVK